MSVFAVSALLRPPHVGAQFTRLQLRPPPLRVGLHRKQVGTQSPCVAIHDKPRVVGQCTVRWPPQKWDTISAHILRPPWPTLGHHPRPTWMPNPVQRGRPDKPTVAAHLRSRWVTTFVQCGRPDKEQWPATSRFHLRLGGRPEKPTPLLDVHPAARAPPSRV